MVTRFPRGHFSCLYIIRIKEHTAGHLGSEKTKSDDNIWAFGWICNPPGLSISIFNALYRIKIGFDFGRRPLVPNTHCVGIIPTNIRTHSRELEHRKNQK